ncbi:GPI transamidase component [Imshaugia aleurites]|uniref:GPI transamidase component n=1 Tax=Imshaugia aleurites TaxID=172621 RepID=A0A8H3FME0_9LECA|nr:GPI transamidase component [Imshaugia aleurites]
MAQDIGTGSEDANFKMASRPATAPKQPPPESSKSIKTRGLVILSFWAVVVFLGLPVWLWTTSIYRASLPLQDMLDWADGKVFVPNSNAARHALNVLQACKPTFPLQIAIEAPFLQEVEAAHLVRMTQHALDDLNEFSAHHLRLRLKKTFLSQDPQNASMAVTEDEYAAGYLKDYGATDGMDVEALTVRLQPKTGAQAARAELQSHSAKLDVFYASNQAPSVSSSSSTLATFIAGKLQELFAEEQAIIAYILQSAQTMGQASQIALSASSTPRELRPRFHRSLNPELAAKMDSRMTRSLKYAPTYHITVSLFTPSATPSSWEIESALAEYFTPLLDSISGVSNFTVDTQVQLYAAFSPSVQSPEYDTEQQTWTLREEDLSGFINAAEWPLSPSIGAGPTLNFVLYVPDRSTSPLVVKGSRASSWLIPQWGGVVILNPQDTNATSSEATLSKESIQPALLTFSHQLLSFLGAPQTPPSLPLQIQTLTRLRAASLLLSASSTMGSLARLTVALPSIAIPETVSSAVDTTLMHLRTTCDSLKGGKFRDALENARIAEIQAEKGFFEKSMVGQVYFPDEHKIAVYLPLLGPVGVPLLMSALKELRRLWASRKIRQPG